MRVNRQLTFLLVAFVLLILFLHAISNILLPFVLGFLVAYMMDPIVDRLEAKKVKRGTASGLVLAIFFCSIIAVAVFTIPLIVDQIEGLITKFPEYQREFNQELIPMLKQKVAGLSPALSQQINDKAKEIPNNITHVLGNSLEAIFASSLWLFNIISLILITPIVSFYLLRDWDISMARIYSLLPQNYAPIIKRQAKKVDDTISAFLRGELTVCAIMAVLYAAAYTTLGLSFGFLIGVITGILTFIPYIGPVVGGLIAIIIACLQYSGVDDGTWQILYVAIAFIVLQNIESNLITPKIVGNKIGVHPAWLIFTMLAGASLLGLLGVIIAVPVTAVIAVLLRFAIERYEHSSYYLRNRNVDNILPEDKYQGEPGSILRVDEPAVKRAKPAKRIRKRKIAQRKKNKTTVH